MLFKKFFLNSRFFIINNMSSMSFIQHLNPLSNKIEWKVYEEYDYNQEIATSCYGDMLHDDERNKKFGEALKIAILKQHSLGKEAHVLDIGTGTGLLSMLAVKYGADSVTACEAFLPMANCAVNIIKANNFSEKIKVVKCHSTSLTVGEHCHMKQKANILVSEVFDTELIGEGAINTFNHAFENLLTDDCIVIPSSGTVYAQVVESDLAQKWNVLHDWYSRNQVLLKVPKEFKTCTGTGAVHDIQLSEFNQEYFKVLSKPIPVFTFEWAKKKKIQLNRQTKSVIKAISSGKAQIIFMWWKLEMDEEGKVEINCAPVWEHPDGKGKDLSVKTLTKMLPWRDHWMQAVYFISNELTLEDNCFFTLISNHDEFSFWFAVKETNSRNMENTQPFCNCSFHFLLSRGRVGGLNDTMRRHAYLQALEKIITNDTICIVLGDISLIGFLTAKLGALKVFIISDNPVVEKLCSAIASENNLSDVLFVQSNLSQIVEMFDENMKNKSVKVLILSEPYFRNSILPWDNIIFWYTKDEICRSIYNKVQSIVTMPTQGTLKCCAVQFDNLWRISSPLDTCEGFSMNIFDRLIISAKEKAENYVESQPLWEYPGIALSLPISLYKFNFNDEVPKEKVKTNGTIKFNINGRCDGIALWMEYDLSVDCSLSFGPVKEITVGEYITWDMFERQGVHLFRNRSEVKIGDTANYEAEFDPGEAEFNFLFSIMKQNNSEN